jgi:hypothetical protein
MIVNPDPTNEKVIEFVWKHRKERHLFRTRHDRAVELKY